MPLEPLHLQEVAAAHAASSEAQALRQAVAERLEQHRRKRGTGATLSAQTALPGMAGMNERNAAKPNRVADSVAARFARSQSYREFLQQEAESATRQAEAAAEVARRNAEAIAASQQQLLHEMQEWEERQQAASAEPAVEFASEIEPQHTYVASAPEPGVLLPMMAAPVREMEVLGPSEALREAVAAPLLTETRASVAEPPVERQAVPVEAVPVAAAAVVPQPVKIAMPVPDPAEPPVPIPANLIEFPRQLVAARKARPRFAEGPLREDADSTPERAQLRIFEVEASSFSTTPTAEPVSTLPEWSSIRLDSSTAEHEMSQPDAQMSMALPVYAASLERRVMAAAVDGCCVGVAFLLAVAAAGMAGGALPTGLFALGASAVTLLLFGVGYLLLSFTLSGQTVGMRYARIALCTFGDDNPTRSAMRRRLFAMGLSAVSLGLGFAWAMLDDDKLGWHDRISRMYQRAY
ncbi:RDD family protein [Terriglobus aquaticus]|uniref:RDD family protein n=1 Tax=Terriglobus aquaticus TaxID=940139 RepID=A0ABW9KF40_9BACT